MATSQIGTDLEIGVGQTMTDYIVVNRTLQNDDIKTEDVDDEDGALATRLVFRRHDSIELELVAKSGATPETDFVKGAICTLAPLANYYIEDVSIERVEGAARVRVTGKDLGIT